MKFRESTREQPEGGGLSARRLDFVKLNYKQAIDAMTQDMIEQAKQSNLGREVLKES